MSNALFRNSRISEAPFVIKMLNIFVILVSSLVMLGWAGTASTGERGQAPQCQQHCLANHVKAMQKLSDDLAKSGKILIYQDLVETEISNYSSCITNCRVILPVK